MTSEPPSDSAPPNDASDGDASDDGDAASSPRDGVGMRITSTPDRTEIEQPETGDAHERPDVPFRILFVSDLTPSSSPDDWSDGRHVRRVDTNSFASTMETMAPTLTVEVPNTLSDTPDTWTLDLTFTDLKDFSPMRLAQQIGPTAQLLDVIDLVEAVGEGDLDLDAFRDRLGDIGVEMDWVDDLYRTLSEQDDGGASSSADSAASSAPSSADGGDKDASLDRLMGMVDPGNGDDAGSSDPEPRADAGTDGDPVSSFTDALMDAVRGDASAPDFDASTVDRMRGELKAIIAEQLQPVVQHPDVRKLESAWRGLRFLVQRLPFRENVQLSVLSAGRDDLHEAMHYQVLLPEHSDERDEPPVSLILIDEAFGKTQPDIDQLDDLAGTGESLQSPVVASVAPSFFGIEKMSGLAKLPSLRSQMKGDDFATWRGLRRKDAAQFLGLTVPQFLLRRPHDGTTGTDALPVREDEGLMGSGALVVGVAAARSFAETGWPTHLSDVTIDELPLHSVREGKSPLEVVLSGRTQSELAGAGFIVLGGRANDDALRVMQAPMVRRPDTYDDAEAAAAMRAKASLPCRLFVARAAHRLLLLEDELDPSKPLDDLRAEVAAVMASFLGVDVPDAPSDEEARDRAEKNGAGDAEDGEDAAPALQPISVEHVTDVDLPDHEVLAVRLRPPADILSTRVRLAMILRVPMAD